MLRTYGVSGLKAHIRNHLHLGKLFHSLVLSRQDLFRVLTPPAFALTVFTVVPQVQEHDTILTNGASDTSVTDGLGKGTVPPQPDNKQLEEANTLTKEVYELVNSRGEIFITSTVVNGTYAIRVVSANPLAAEKYVRRAFNILVSTAEEVLWRTKSQNEKISNG